MNKHLNSYVHKILAVIKRENRPYSFKEVEKETSISIATVITALRKNPKVKIENNKIVYVSEFKIYTREDLVSVLKEEKSGIEMSRLNDGPVDIMKIINDKPSENKSKSDAKDEESESSFGTKSPDSCSLNQFKDEFIILRDMDGSEIIFYNDFVLEMDSSVKELWNAIKIPNYHDILEELKVAGLKTNIVVKRKGIVKAKKPKKNKRRIKVTNTHVEGLDLTEMNDSDY